MTDIWRPVPEDFVEAHDQAGMVSKIRTAGFRNSESQGMQRIEDILDDSEEYSDPYEIAAFILRELVNRQPFSDGNHRTGIILAKQVLRKNCESFNISKLKTGEEIRDDMKWNLKHSDTETIAKWMKTGEI